MAPSSANHHDNSHHLASLAGRSRRAPLNESDGWVDDPRQRPQPEGPRRLGGSVEDKGAAPAPEKNRPDYWGAYNPGNGEPVVRISAWAKKDRNQHAMLGGATSYPLPGKTERTYGEPPGSPPCARVMSATTHMTTLRD
jgi:hypothetical protein